MKFLLLVLVLIGYTALCTTPVFADDADFDKLMIQRKKPVYREAAPERSYQDDDAVEQQPKPSKKAKKAKKAAQQESANEEIPQSAETGGLSKAGDGYVVRLLGCQRNGNTLECRLNITNNSKHNSFSLSSRCTADDNFGNSYNSLNTYAIGGKPDGQQHEITSGMSSDGYFSLKVTPNARSLNRLVFHIISARSQSMEFEIKNVGL